VLHRAKKGKESGALPGILRASATEGPRFAIGSASEIARGDCSPFDLQGLKFREATFALN
jgi:hypothetical protein